MRYREFKPKFFEAFSNIRKEKGEVAFRTSAIDDRHIQKIIQDMSTRSGVPVNEIVKKISDDIEVAKEIGRYSPKLYDTLLNNIVESTVFDLIWKSTIPVKLEEYKFDKRIFARLISLVEQDHEEWFINGVKAPGESKRLYDITPILVPSSRPQYQKFNSCTTAMATANGDFIFNVPFMEKLLYYGAIIDVQPTGLKYEINGGSIPNNYCYIEFLIVHELLHYAFGDFASGNKYKLYDSTTHNWASDLRSNYLLVKSGYTQIPVGLFSDDINFDRKETDSYHKLVKVVADELEKLPKEYQAWIEGKIEIDNHGQPADPNAEPKEQPEWEPKIGEIVLHNKEGTLGAIEKINPDGTYTTRKLNKEEEQWVKDAGIKIG